MGKGGDVTAYELESWHEFDAIPSAPEVVGFERNMSSYTGIGMLLYTFGTPTGDAQVIHAEHSDDASSWEAAPDSAFDNLIGDPDDLWNVLSGTITLAAVRVKLGKLKRYLRFRITWTAGINVWDFTMLVSKKREETAFDETNRAA